MVTTSATPSCRRRGSAPPPTAGRSSPPMWSASCSGATVVYGACEDGLTVPYQPWMAALSHLVAHVDDAALSSLSPLHAAALSRLVPGLAARLRAGDALATPVGEADTERYLLVESVVHLLAATAGDAPVVV